MSTPKNYPYDYESPSDDIDDLEDMLYARHVEVESFSDLEKQRATNIPALFNSFYKFVQNPSSVSVETFKRMIDTDDTIGPGVDFLTSCIAARLGRYQHPNKEITEWVNVRLADIQGGWFNCVKEILSATWAGFSVSEKVWANTDNGFVPSKIITLPCTTILFETERTGEISSDGILQYQRNWNPLSLGLGMGYFGGAVTVGFGFLPSSASPDPFAKFGDLPFPMRTANSYNYLCVRIPRQKCIHYSYDAQGKFGNPYGRSLLRRAYKFWVMKDTYLRMMSVALDRKGTPLTIVYADPNTTLIDPDKAQGNNVRNQRDKGIRADQAAKKAFENVHNDSTIILPGKKGQIFETDFVPQDANTDAFLAAINKCDQGMLRALLIPSLIFGNGDGTGSFALGQEHGKTFNTILDGVLEGLQQTLLHELIKEMLSYNFPENQWKKDGLGTFGKRDYSQEEILKVMQVYEGAITAGIINTNDLNDLNKMRDSLGFSPVDEKQQFNMNDDDNNTTFNNDISNENSDNITNPSIHQSANELQDLALNGAQVSSLLEIIDKVTTGTIPKSSAIEIIHAAFPLINKEVIGRFIAPIEEQKEQQKPFKKDNQNGDNEGNIGTNKASRNDGNTEE